jgi:hypothetical protein
MLPKVGFGLAAAGLIGLAAWYMGHGAKLPPSPEAPPQSIGPRRPLPATVPLRYDGRTAEQWAQVLAAGSWDQTKYACQALRVLGAQGRPYLLQGLDHPNPETRRMCLENLTVSDFRGVGEPGRQALVRLSGDGTDYRIRERANAYLNQWNRSIPALHH